MSSIRDIRTEVIFKVPRRLGFEAKIVPRRVVYEPWPSAGSRLAGYDG